MRSDIHIASVAFFICLGDNFSVYLYCCFVLVHADGYARSDGVGILRKAHRDAGSLCQEVTAVLSSYDDVSVSC